MASISRASSSSFPSGNRGYLSATVDYSDWIRVLNWIGAGQGVADSPAVLTPAIRVVGQELLDNYNGEVGPGSAWQKLTTATRSLREKRGYPAAKPVLNQSGGLKAASVEILAHWSLAAPRTHSVAAAYKNSGATSFNASQTSRRFEATVSGPKVENQYGSANTTGERYGAGYLPRRPFWYIPSGIEDEMARATLNAFELNWADTSLGIAKFTPDPFNIDVRRGARNRS